MSDSSSLPPFRPFLGVSRSVLGRAWRDACDDAGAARAMAIAQLHGVPDILARVLAARGVTSDGVPGFLEPKLRDLMPDPSVLQGMDAAVDRLARAVCAGEMVAIFGDYDVDGACSAALLAAYLARCGTPFAIHIPDRISEGYGPNVEAIRALRASGADLLVTVDCGTASHGPLDEAARLGLDTVVIDHHQAPETLPAAIAVVNPNRQDDLSGLGHLCAAGVVFLVLVGLNRALRACGFWKGRAGAPGGEPNLLADLDLVALATIADVVRLEGLNRAFVRQGLSVMRQRHRIGLTALLDVTGLSGPPEPWHLGYLVGPRINAGGRIGDAALGAKLLLADDPVEAGRIAADLDRLNRERQVIEQVAVEEASVQALAALDRVPDLPVLVTASETWHPGVVGLVAARLKERFQRPAFAFAVSADGTSSGSGRSVMGVDLGRAVRAAVAEGLAIKGGGHAMAAGVTLASERLEAFGIFVAERLKEAVAVAGGDAALAVDAALTAAGASQQLLAMIEKAGPYGSGNAEPVFAFPHHRLVDAAVVGSNHVRVRLRAGDGASISGIAFRAADQPLGQALLGARGEMLHVAGTLSLDRWGGGTRVDLRVVDAALMRG
ncbi:single-stranded-DNA-specific exonuclease RecJ [Chelatococcus sp. SYSU_G07232]|uniref:Single-stranded-DNA-specific exonuclease RecJ n=1 Tax=Chelatococcus albus TaxID=3047466 RepID=A0ABT7AC01_9HYPH|nr:single-stranded-DNA-specific exonuclease RecJ [Chelatococcus sp. SYSU_G07232]MDJ1156890.1 single-stranded-DNA-specific exonuclease RecJ [Chelatococcus sp. SYSU_G07232]